MSIEQGTKSGLVVGAKIVREAKSGLTYGRKMLGKILFGEKYFEFSEKNTMILKLWFQVALNYLYIITNFTVLNATVLLKYNLLAV
jgi:hypothetical protein